MMHEFGRAFRTHQAQLSRVLEQRLAPEVENLLIGAKRNSSPNRDVHDQWPLIFS